MHTIWKLTFVLLLGTSHAQVMVTTWAGNKEFNTDGPRLDAQFNKPYDVAIDASGNMYVTDYFNSRIRKITPAGVVSTFAGSTSGYADGIGTAAKFVNPSGVAVDASGNVYVADYQDDRIRKITPTGVVTTLAGSTGGYADGTGTAAKFNCPDAVVVDASGNVYVSDNCNHCIRKITPAGVVTTLAGSTSGYADGTGTAAKFYYPKGLALDTSGNLYVADNLNHRIRKITPAGVVTTLAGSTAGYANGSGAAAKFNYPKDVALDSSGNVYVVEFSSRIRLISPIGVVSTLTTADGLGYVEGISSVAQFSSPSGITRGANGILYVADAGNDRIRMISPTGEVSTYAGRGKITDGIATGAQFNQSRGITTDRFGNLYVADNENQRIRKITADKLVSTYAGMGYTGYVDGPDNVARFRGPSDVAVDNSGNVYVADKLNSRIRKITPDGQVSTFAGGIGGFADGIGVAARFNNPSGITIDRSGNMYVVDEGNWRIRKITPDGVVTTFAGSTQGYADGIGTAAQFFQPAFIAHDASGNLYVTDYGGHRIRKITPDAVVSTLAGSGVAGYADGLGAAASFRFPYGIAVDLRGNIYVADNGNNRIRKITPNGVVTTLAGGAFGDTDGEASISQFYDPVGLTIDKNGDLYVMDRGNFKIRKITLPKEWSIIEGTTFSGDACLTGNNRSGVMICSTDGKYRTWSSYDGDYDLHVYDTLQHSYNVIPPRYFSTVCADFSHKFNSLGDTLARDFTVKQDTACLLLKVDMATARHRRCFDNNIYYIDYRNAGTEAAQNAYIRVQLDPLLQPMSSTLPWRLPQSGSDLYFDLGTLTPGQTGQIHLTYTVSCDALLDQTLCSRAHIYPDSSCWRVNPDGTPGEPGAPNNNTWDKSSVKVEGHCSNDSAIFTITNTGEPGNGDMDGNSQYRVYVNDGLAITQNFRLTGGQSLTLRYYAPGYSIRLEADQRPGHPGFSKPRETLACGEMTAKTTFLPPVGSPPQDDEDVFVEEDCQRVIGAFDPNDKAVYPSGISEKQYVKENTLMEYKVRFQNTGNDTAFNIVVRDTLDNDLDLSTVEPGVASHPYTFATNGRMLIWYFDNIQLPDSFVNEPKSHGFFKFKVRQNANLPRGTVVTNRVGIYFDYNDPVITNDAWFTVGDTTFASPISVSQLTARTTVQDAQLQLYPNPTASNLTVVSPQPGTYILQNLLGQPVLQGALPVGRTTLLLEALPAGTYLLRATIGTTTEVHKVVKR